MERAAGGRERGSGGGAPRGPSPLPLSSTARSSVNASARSIQLLGTASAPRQGAARQARRAASRPRAPARELQAGVRRREVRPCGCRFQSVERADRPSRAAPRTRNTSHGVAAHRRRGSQRSCTRTTAARARRADPLDSSVAQAPQRGERGSAQRSKGLESRRRMLGSSAASSTSRSARRACWTHGAYSSRGRSSWSAKSDANSSHNGLIASRVRARSSSFISMRITSRGP